MTQKRKLADTDLESKPAIPPSLPPSVEEAYRRKCVQLKNRTHEVEEANDAARLRLTRIRRQVEKLRIERAFLLEQLSKRTSTNVEDSEGSPSPPPTPKDKPLRIKRGHRKVSTIAEDGKEDAGNESPSQEASARGSKRAKTANGVRKSKKSASAKSAFDLYCDETRPILEAKNADDINIEEELTKGWEELAEVDKESYQKKAADKADAKDNEEKEGSPEAEPAPGKEANDDKEDEKGEDGDDNKGDGEDEDVEMANYDTEDGETQMD
ncbi:hypothetical protein NLG97_g2447 [Lecanicillium saksenae]|uniref:Uncharacterized protein n=1 Tax=Lecanicillium saksenae TaxID=468837 RepID=A0ACC1R247_9HYPO|nr:hypothetical protein NLG97_g2447 [Lecanicillium saksenae]